MVKYFSTKEARSINKEKIVEESQFLGGYTKTGFDQKAFEKSNDCVSIWIGKTENGRYYIGIAGRTVPPLPGQKCWTFETCGFQEITEEVYRELLKAEIWIKTKE